MAPLKRFLVSTKPDVWVASRREVALYWRKNYPYEKVGAGPYTK